MLWFEIKDKKQYVNETFKSGIELFFNKKIDSGLKKSCKRFIKWLKTKYYFPILVEIHFKTTDRVEAENGEKLYGLFFGPYDKEYQSYIRIATGEYKDDCANKGRDNARVYILHTIAHELSHYFQWIQYGWKDKKKDEKEASECADYIIDCYKSRYKYP